MRSLRLAASFNHELSIVGGQFDASWTALVLVLLGVVLPHLPISLPQALVKSYRLLETGRTTKALRTHPTAALAG